MSDTPAPDPSEIPLERLPAGFAERIEDPPEPAPPRLASTLVLLRPGEADGIELLLLRRVRSAGFVPGAWVFPGGRVDPDDGSPAVLALLGAPGTSTLPQDDGASPPPPSIVAAIREAFEETGILPGVRTPTGPAPTAAEDAGVAEARAALLEGRGSFGEILGRAGWWMDPEALGYIAHWITPVAEPKRYDTRFFAAAVPRETRATLHAAEATDARWVNPAEALELHREGAMPMIFPTLRTLEALRDFPSPGAVLASYRGRAIAPILPRLVRTPTGVGIRMPEEE